MQHSHYQDPRWLFFFLAKLDKLILQFLWKSEGLRIARIILKKNQVGEITLPLSKLITKLQQSRQCNTGRRINTWVNGTELRVQENVLTFMVDWFLTKMPRRFLFNEWCWDNQVSNWIWKGIKLVPYLTPYTKPNPRWIKDLNIGVKTIKLLEENKSKPLWSEVMQWFLRKDTKSTSDEIF